MRVVGSITTIPGRYAKLLRTLRSLHNQDYPLDAIYLGVPKESKRLKQAYPEFPDEIKELCTIVSCDYDYGPCTKIVAGILMENDPDTIIFTFDDDVVYARTLVSSMLSCHYKYPNEAIGSNGALINFGFPFYASVSSCGAYCSQTVRSSSSKDGRLVDSLLGFSGVLYIRKFFPIKDELHEKFLKYPLMDDDVYFNDDIMISAFLSANKINRRVCPEIPCPNEGKIFDPNIDKMDGNEISFDKIAFLQRYRRSINKTIEWGFFSHTENVALDETIGSQIIIIIILSILILILAYFFYIHIRN